MTKDNEQFAREKELAREYEKKMAAREQKIKRKVIQLLEPIKTQPYEIRNFSVLFNKLYIPAFTTAKYQKPSEFFRKEMPWIFDYIIYDRFSAAFEHAVDNIREYPYSVGWCRRSYRSDNYLSYAERIGSIVMHFQDAHCLDADICDVLTGNLPEDAYCYLKSRNTRTAGFAPEVLAYELDQDNPKLEAIVTDIINGDSEFSVVSRDLIKGIVMSHNKRMHQLICKLLVAARLQEGLRQAVCEEADWGTLEAFHAILCTILEYDLIRYSSVKRAVGTWIGVMTEETRDLDRVSNKSVELISKCLIDKNFREECLDSEDSMAIHIALWSATFDNVQKGFQMLDRIIEQGTYHQVLTAGYFVASLENEILRQTAARKVLKQHRDRYDILAVYLPSFLPHARYMVSKMINAEAYSEVKYYFDSNEEAAEFCDWLFAVFQSMKKKELEFNPCIFPWYAASLKKSELIEKSMILAAAMMDQERIDKLCPYIIDCDAYTRDIHLKMMTMGKKTPAVRKAIIDCLQDKSLDTRRAAYQQANGLKLMPEEYRQIENMLRLRYDDLRRNAMELLMKQPDDDLKACIRRLLASSKSPMRTAGLDMVTQLSKSNDRADVAKACMEAVYAMEKPTTQEKILIVALTPRQEETTAEPLFTEADRYVPTVEIGEYERDCIRSFMEIFPDSKLEKQVMAGKQVTHNTIILPVLSCESAKNAQKNLKSLSDFVVAHERDTYDHFSEREAPIGGRISGFSTWREGVQVAPRMDLWEQWRDENEVSTADLYSMMILSSAQPDKYPYLVQCGKYVCDVFGNGFEKPISYRYADHIQRIVYALLCVTVPMEQQQKIALALGIWIARCLPDDMFIGDSGEKTKELPKTNAGEIIIHYADAQVQFNMDARRQICAAAGHFIAHPQFSALVNQIDPSNAPGLRPRIPILLNIYERTYASSGVYMKSHGIPSKGRMTLLLHMIYLPCYRLQQAVIPDVSIYLYARYYDLISDRTLYCHLMDPCNFKSALQLITGVCAMEPKDGNQVSSRIFQNYHGYGIRRSYEEFIGKDILPREEQERLASLCHRTAEKLVPIVVGAELLRGDTPTEYSVYVTGIHVLSGMETLLLFYMENNHGNTGD